MPERRFGPLTRTDFVKYAGASGDFTRIHYDEPFVVPHTESDSVFAMGMLLAGYLGGVAAQ